MTGEMPKTQEGYPAGWLHATVHFDPTSDEWHADGEHGPEIWRELRFMRDLIRETLLWGNTLRLVETRTDADEGLGAQIRRYLSRNDSGGESGNGVRVWLPVAAPRTEQEPPR